MEKKKSISLFARWGASGERDYLLENVSMLVESGMDILAALRSIKSEVRSRSMKRVVDFMIEDIGEGSSFWRTLHRTRIADEHVVAIIRAGEKSGRLAENLKVVSLQRSKERMFKSKIQSAMMYPVLVLVITFVIAIGIAWFILPRLTEVFARLQVDLPLITKILIAVGDFFRAYGAVAVPSFVVGFTALMYFIFFFSRTKKIGQKILFFIPPIKKLIQQIELARFGYVFGTLLEAGLPIVYVLKSVSYTSTFENYSSLYKFLAARVDEGISLRQSFSMSPSINSLIPVPVQHLIVSGEKTGKLSEVLKKIGNMYEEKIDNTTKNLSTLIEPILLIIIWIGVVGVAVAVILPIYSLLQGVHQ